MPNKTIGYFIDFVKKTHRLSSKEANILVLRLKRKKLRTIGRKYKVSYERIRQIEKESLTKLNKKEFQDKLFEG
jgi:DNA-directed RNA polymerase sigma subunit (sigma70/sigma32)